MDFNLFQKIQEEKPFYGELEEPTTISEFKNTGCGDIYRIFLKVQKGKIQEVSFTTTGCPFSLLALSLVAELLKGEPIEKVYKITPEDIEKKVGGFPERRKIYAEVALCAFQKAIEDYKENKGVPKEKFLGRSQVLKKLQEKKHLRGEKLDGVMLNDLKLDYIDFSGASLRGAFLEKSSLKGANFQGADLRGAFLNYAILEDANFQEADLRGAKLLFAKLEGAKFDKALYDIGTKVHPKDIHIFQTMRKVGKSLYAS